LPGITGDRAAEVTDPVGQAAGRFTSVLGDLGSSSLSK
jgi:hypothetical protein